MAEGGFWAVCGVWVWPGFLRELCRWDRALGKMDQYHTLAPMVVPIAKELIKRFLPRTEVTIKTTTIRGKSTTEIHIGQV